MFRNWSNPFADGQPEQVNIPVLGELIGSHGQPIRVGVLISGRGSNLQALLDARETSDKWELAVVISNVVGAQGLARAEKAGVPAMTIPHGDFADRKEFETKLDEQLQASKVDLVVLAGFMRVLSPSFCEKWRNRAINIHPSLLPAFRGLHTHRRALEAGVSEHGCTVHYVCAELDAGPVIDQAQVPVHPDDTEEMLAARVLKEEHRILPQAVDFITEHWLNIENKQVLGDNLWEENGAMVMVVKNSSSKSLIGSRWTDQSPMVGDRSVNLPARSLQTRTMAWMLQIFSVRRRMARHHGGSLRR